MIKLLVSGDFCPHQRIEKLVFEGKFDKIYNDFLPVILNNDINIVNLECPLTNESNAIEKIGPNLMADGKCIEALKFGHFNVATLANNHIMDQGEAGLISTINLCKSNYVEVVGVGENIDEASKILYLKTSDKKVAIINVCENEFSIAETNRAGANPINPIRNHYQIKEARELADYVVVIIHGGHEEYSLPSPRMVDTYRFFVDSGADIVVGHHTHCYSGYEQYKNGLIFYSLGNFIFDWEEKVNSDWNYGYVVKFIINDDKISFEIIPYKQCSEAVGVFLLTDNEKIIFDENIKKLNEIIGNRNSLLEKWNAFSEKMKNSYLLNFEISNSRILRSLRYRKLIPSFISKKQKLQLLNMLRCESHRDLAIESLKSDN